MNITKENLDALNAVVKVDIEATDYQEKVDKMLTDYRKKANIPGFRKGHGRLAGFEMVGKTWERGSNLGEMGFKTVRRSQCPKVQNIRRCQGSV